MKSLFLVIFIVSFFWNGDKKTTTETEIHQNKVSISMELSQSPFAEAEAYANDYIQKQIPVDDVPALIQKIEACIQTMMIDQKQDKVSMYANFSIGKNMDIYQTDTTCLLQTADVFYESGLLTPQTLNVPEVLVKTCVHLSARYGDLIAQYPEHPFAQIVNGFKIEIIQELSPRLLNSAMKPVYEACDYNIAFYQKVILLHRYYQLAYLYLIEKGRIKFPDKE